MTKGVMGNYMRLIVVYLTMYLAYPNEWYVIIVMCAWIVVSGYWYRLVTHRYSLSIQL